MQLTNVSTYRRSERRKSMTPETSDRYAAAVTNSNPSTNHNPNPKLLTLFVTLTLSPTLPLNPNLFCTNNARFATANNSKANVVLLISDVLNADSGQ